MSGLFVDPEFPPCVSSLVRRGGTPLSPLCDRITWLRPQEICPSPRLFAEKDRLALGRQGILGDCWFICACYALHKSTKLLHQVFPRGQHTWNEPGYTGCFTCRFWRFGRWVEVTIDDCLPCLGQKLCFSHCQDQGVFWLPLLEKAYAKGDKWALMDKSESDKFLYGLQDGEFWVEKEEFLQEFNEVIMAFPMDEMEHIQSIWTDCPLLHAQQLYGSWVKGQTAGGSRNNVSFTDNPKFWLVVREQSEVYLALMQRPQSEISSTSDTRRNQSRSTISKSTPLYAIGLHVWRVEKRRFNLQKTVQSPVVAGTSSHSYDRQLHLQCELSPGYYLVIPSTFLRDTEGDFLLRVLSSGPITLSEITSHQPLVNISEDDVKGTWETREVKGQWKKDINAGGSRNFPSYCLNPTIPFIVPSKARLVRVTLKQHCQGKHCHAIGFHVYMVPSDSNLSPFVQEPRASCIPHSYSHEVSIMCDLSPGQYIIVPSTYLPNEECDFSVFISTKMERKSIQSQEALGKILHEVSVVTVMK
ncbi:calpain-10 isoform X2 [Lithobates pipiens]